VPVGNDSASEHLHDGSNLEIITLAMALLLDPGKIIGLAHGANPARWGDPINADYPALVSEFLALLEKRQIPFVVVGGIALLQHVPGRNTEDIVLIISAPRLAEIPELNIRERTEMFAYARFGDLRVEILFAEHPLFSLVAKDFTAPMDYRIGKLLTATVDGLILLKLFSLPSLYRQFDLDRIAIYEADIMQLLPRSKREDIFFLDLLTPYALESDRRELARILSEIRTRLSRIRKS
jgi:hypothetical protein